MEPLIPAAENAALRPSRPEDLAEVLALLMEVELPTSGVEEAFDGFIVAQAGRGIVGAAGLERYGRDALVRSVAVLPAWRGRGLGGALTAEILRVAGSEGIQSVYLLTETAAEFFPRYGFQQTSRSEVAKAVQASEEFTRLCPTSSIVMARTIGSAPAPG